jgi:hypothetical protein
MGCLARRITHGEQSGRDARQTAEYPDKPDPNDLTEKLLFEPQFKNCRDTEHLLFHHDVGLKATRSKKLIEHIVISFEQDEKPDFEQCKQAVAFHLKAIGCSNAMSKWVVHENTDNRHIHLIVVRLDANDPSKVIKPSFILDKLHKGSAQTNFVQGWRPLKNAPWSFDGKHFFKTEKTESQLEEQDRSRVSAKAEQGRVHTASPSFNQICNDELFDLLNEARKEPSKWTWAKLHAEIQKKGFELEPAKGGLVVRQGEQVVKATSVCKQFKRKELESHWGAFAPAAQKIAPAIEAKSAPIETLWQRYQRERDAHKQLKADPLNHVRIKFDDAIGQQFADYRTIKANIRIKQQGNSPFEKAFTKAELSIAAADHAKRLASLKEQKKAAVNQARQLGKFSTWTQFKAKNAAEFDKNAEESKKPKGGGVVVGSYLEAPDLKQNWLPLKADIRSFDAVVISATEVAYRSSDSDPAFIDSGSRISFVTTGQASLLAGMQLAVAKWGSFTLTGGDDYKRKCIEIAVQEGFANKINNAELKPLIEVEVAKQKAQQAIARAQAQAQQVERAAKANLGKPKVPPLRAKDENGNQTRHREVVSSQVSSGSKPLVPALRAFDSDDSPCSESAQLLHKRILQKYAQGHRSRGEPMQRFSASAGLGDRERMSTQDLFRQFHSAVAADGYRVMSGKMWTDEKGVDQTQFFYFGDKDSQGKPEALRTAYIERRLPEFINKWQGEKGENLYLVPVSEGVHHVLIDDLTKDKLQRLVEDGFKPCAVTETSPGNFQAVVNVPKQSTDPLVNSKVENALIDYLNKRYGDEKLMGTLHPMRFPGFENRKVKAGVNVHQQHDGSFFEVRLRKFENRQCDQSLNLAKKFASEAQANIEKQKAAPKPVGGGAVVNGNIGQAYDFFVDEVRGRFGDDMHIVDDMVAVRLLALGFSATEVVSAIASGSPLVRPASELSKHNWGDYAQRAVDAAQRDQAALISDYSRSYRNLWFKQLGWGRSLDQSFSVLDPTGSLPVASDVADPISSSVSNPSRTI